MMVHILEILLFHMGVAFYLLSGAWALGSLLRPKKFTYTAAKLMAALGCLSHLFFFLTRLIEGGYLPITNLFESLAFFVWAGIAVYLLVDRSYPLPSLASFLLPLAVLFSFVSLFLFKPQSPVAPDELRGYWFSIHVLLAFMGYAAFTVGFASALMYLLQEWQLKAKMDSGLMKALPSLEVLDRVNLRLVSIGFPLFTMALVAGFVWAHSSYALGPNWERDPKVISSVVTWLLYAALFHIRRTSQLAGKKIAYLTIVAFAFVLFTFLGTNLILKGPHQYLM